MRASLRRPGIYVLINIENGKSYIGSSVSLYDRLLDYFQPAYIANQPNRHINRAIVKYGIESFLVVIIEFTNHEDLHKSEQAWIDGFKPEYNVLTYVSSLGGYKLTQEQKDKISKAITGKKQSAEQRAALSARVTGTGNPLWGRKHSEASKELMRLHAHKTSFKPSKAVEIKDTNTGITTSYISMRKAAKELQTSHSAIQKANGKLFRGRYHISVKVKLGLLSILFGLLIYFFVFSCFYLESHQIFFE